MQSSTTTGQQGSDKLVYYASVFVYDTKLKSQFKDYCPTLNSYESKNIIDLISKIDSQMFPQGSTVKFQEFISMTDEQQRLTIADVQITIVNISMQKEKAEEYIKLFFQIVKKVKGDAKLITYALLLIDGILEEKRSRIQILVNI